MRAILTGVRLGRSASLVALMLSIAPLAARAEVSQSAPDSFFLEYSAPLKATPAKAYAAIAAVATWWSDDNTYSGKSANLSLKPEAGACFCERWNDGSAEHGRVIMAVRDHLLRMDIALGPLQEYALKGTLSFWIRADADNASTLAVEYRVNGSSVSGLDALAPQVDALLGNEVDRLQRFINSGSPTGASGNARSNPAAADPDAVTDPKSRGKSAGSDDILKQWAAQAREDVGATGKTKPAKPLRKPSDPKPAASPDQPGR